ncbi:hypothetical protein [Treponema sp.]|uniref:hypothetical protein n=1 Tax=Treponema sp. TaxID=166 RepID=UPI0025D4C214|nr:hypothetical protein [Treponema sp.]MCR5219230.1 hypothetical protein [Treponema sp.]
MINKLKSFFNSMVFALALSCAFFSFSLLSCSQDDDSNPEQTETEAQNEEASDSAAGTENADGVNAGDGNTSEDNASDSAAGTENADGVNAGQDNSVEEIEFTGYVIEGFYQKDTDPSDDSLTITKNTLTDYSGNIYTIKDYAVWLESTTEGFPLRVAYLVTDGKNNYLCSVWYYINNGKDYIKWNPPVESALTSCPAEFDYNNPDCNTGNISKALKSDLTWSVEYYNETENLILTISKTPGKNPHVSYGSKEWDVSFNTFVKNMELSMPAGEDRMEMEVDEALWWSSSTYSPALIHEGKARIDYPLIDSYTAFYELQCCNSYGMYLLSVTKGNYNYDEEEDMEYIDYSIIGNFTLTEEEYNKLMVHYR